MPHAGFAETHPPSQVFNVLRVPKPHSRMRSEGFRWQAKAIAIFWTNVTQFSELIA